MKQIPVHRAAAFAGLIRRSRHLRADQQTRVELTGGRTLAMRLGFRPLDGCAERIVYRQLFPSGLTACDALDEASLGTRPSRLHLAAQKEVRELCTLLQLPSNDRARRRAAARAEWFAAANTPLDGTEATSRTG